MNFIFGPIPKSSFKIIIKSDNMKYGNTFNWSLGITQGNQIIIKDPSVSHIKRDRFYEVLKHELNHIYLNRLNKGNNDIPRWFSEGFCLKFASEISLNHNLTVIKHLNNKHMFNIFDIDNFFSSKSKKDFQLGYALSAVLINIITDIYGEDTIYKIIYNINNGFNFNDSFYNATLTETKTFNNIAYEKIKSNYKWMKLIEFPNFLFILFPLLLIIAFIMKKIHNKRLLMLWEAEELIKNEELLENEDEFN
jgi:hypothetical protein